MGSSAIPSYRRCGISGRRTHFEVEASKYRLNYIKLDGNVSCIVNGAGLAMATMDIIKLAGAEPANFLDVGGGASAETVENAFRILLMDPQVQAVFINVFGGILRCDVFAQGVVQAVKNVQVQLPVVVRMEGTNVEKGRELLQESGLNFMVANGMQEAAEKVVMALHRSGGHRHEHSRRCTDAIAGARHYRPRGHIPYRTGDCLRHDGGGRGGAGARGHHAFGRPSVQYRRAGRTGDRRPIPQSSMYQRVLPPMPFWRRSTPVFP